MHTLRYGGAFPGKYAVDCVNDPDTSELAYANPGRRPVPVYFVVAGGSSSEGGEFVLEWAVESGAEAAGGIRVLYLDTLECALLVSIGVDHGHLSRLLFFS